MTFLHTNDFHGTLNGPRLERLRQLREGKDLYFDSGDAIKAGNLAIPFRPDPVWPILAELGCTASSLGNRETHVLEAGFKKKIEGATHPLLCANLTRKGGERPLPASLLIEVRGIRVGVLAVMVPMVTARMKTQAASAYLWEPPIRTAVSLAQAMRPNVDLLIALTHIGYRQDLLLAEACPALDVVFGGHSHTVLEEPERIGDTWICQGGSHGRFAGVYTWEGGQLEGRLEALQ
jgi:5'-nucleotidase